MQGQMAIERNGPPSGGGYLSSSDFGIGVDGKWNADQFHFQAGIYNGENYNGALGDQRKDLMARASYRLTSTDDGSRLGGLRLTAYGQYGKPTGGGERQRFIGMVSYRTMGLTLAAQYGITKDSTTGAAGQAGKGTTGHVISAFGMYHLPQTRFSVLARYDMAKQNANLDSTQTTRIIAGASYQLSPNLRLLGDFDFLSYASGFTETTAQHAAKHTAFLHAMFTF